VPGGLLLTAAITVHAALLWIDPELVIEIGGMPAGLQNAFRALALACATLMLAFQVMSLLGRMHQHRRRIVALVAIWWVIAAVESMMVDWQSVIWLAELALAWLAANCLRIVAREEARELLSVNRRS